jgi:lysophospholipase L1-like esterase
MRKAPIVRRRGIYLVCLLMLALPVTLVACSLLPGPSRPPTKGTGGAGLPDTTVTPSLVYAAIGASDAFGVGTDDPKTDAWPVVLARSLGVVYRLVNLGIPGATVELAARDELPIALDVQPDVITVWLAANDLDTGVPLPTYRSQLQALLHALATGTHARIYVGNLPDLTLVPYFAHRNRDTLASQVRKWNGAIATVCAEEHVSLVDLYSTWTELAGHPEYIGSDGFHPSTAGAARLADLFAIAIVGFVPSRPNRAGAS